MQPLLAKLQAEFPNLRYTPSKQFCWSPETNEIFYKPGGRDKRASWSLLHETGHALLKHASYTSDFELLKLEIAAWEKAKALGKCVEVVIDEDHIQDCLDTYRDWLHRRSICPTCSAKSLQADPSHYRCFNCSATWKVTPSRFCRTYRTVQSVKPLPVFNEKTDF